MSDIIYDLHCNDITGLNKKTINNLFEQRYSNYKFALMTKTRLSLSEKAGVSFVDAIAAVIDKPSFMYVQLLNTGRYYFLVIINHAVWTSKELEEESVEGSVQMFLDQHGDLSLYCYNVPQQQKFNTHNLHCYEHYPLDDIDLKDYILQPIPLIKKQLNRQQTNVFVLTIIVLLCVSLFLFFMLHDKKHQKKPKPIDHWISYRAAINKPQVDLSVDKVFKEIKHILFLPNIGIKSVSYKNGQVIVNVIDFGAAVSFLEDWAKTNQYQFKPVNNHYQFSKQLLFKRVKRDQYIVSANRVFGETIDKLKRLMPNVSYRVLQTQHHENYQVLRVRLQYKSEPLAVIESVFQKLHPYPIVLHSIDGVMNDQGFSGSVIIDIVGE